MRIRITQTLLVNRVLYNLNRQSRQILDLQEQLATADHARRMQQSRNGKEDKR